MPSHHHGMALNTLLMIYNLSKNINDNENVFCYKHLFSVIFCWLGLADTPIKTTKKAKPKRLGFFVLAIVI